MNSKSPPVFQQMRPHGSQGFRDARNREAIARGFVVRTQSELQPVYNQPEVYAPRPSGNVVDPQTGLPRGNMAQIEADKIRQQAYAVGRAQPAAPYYPGHDGVSPVERQHFSSNAPPYGQPPNYYQQLAEGHTTVPDDVRAASQQRQMPRITPGHPHHLPPPMPPRVEPPRPQPMAHVAPPPIAPPLNRRPDHMSKGRTYVSSPREAPQGAALKQGEHGGLYYEGSAGVGNFPQGSKTEAHGKSPVPTSVSGQKTAETAQPLGQEKTRVSLPPVKEKSDVEVSVLGLGPNMEDQDIKAPDMTPGKVDPKTGDVTAEPTEEQPAEKPEEEKPAEDTAPVAPKDPKDYSQTWGDAASGAFKYGKQIGKVLATPGGAAHMQALANAPEQAAAAVSAHRKRAELTRQAHEAYQKEYDTYQQSMRHHEAKQTHRAKADKDKQEQDAAVGRSKEAMEALSEDQQWATPGKPTEAPQSSFQQQQAAQQSQAAIPAPSKTQSQSGMSPYDVKQQQDSFRQDIKSIQPALSGFTTYVRQ